MGTIAFLKDKNYPEAERYFRAAIVAGPEDLFCSYTNLGTVLIFQRKEQEAIIQFENSLNYSSSKAVIWNLYLLNKAVGNEERLKFYHEELEKFSNQ